MRTAGAKGDVDETGQTVAADPTGEQVDAPVRSRATAPTEASPALAVDRTAASAGEGSGLQEPALAEGDAVDHYEVSRLLGRGGMGEVYLARDTQLGRRVALKMVHPRLMGSRKAVTRFLMEARATARFSHPNIVGIYGVGEHAGAPYVALEYAQGQTLLDRMQERQLSLGEALRIGQQIAKALAEAHDHGVLHRDLKPENVIIAPDGRVRVLDFGLAMFVGKPSPKRFGARPSRTSSLPPYGGLAPEVMGTPAYMAPEQWLGQPLEASADIWALGVMLYELCTGRAPFEAGSAGELKDAVTGDAPIPNAAAVSDVPEEVGSLIAQCLDRDALQRPDAEQIDRQIGEILHPGRRQLSEEQCPFRGLLPFAQRHADFFFGREEQISALVERARSRSVLPVVGPSGVGKSSFVQAGFIPRLREQARWTVVRLRPGATPFRTLAARLVRTDSRISGRSLTAIQTAEVDAEWVEAVDELAERLFASPKLLAFQLEQRAEHGACKVLLFVDQLEELFTHGHDDEVCRRFIEAICSAADDPDGPVRSVFTVRGDFLDRVALGPEARDALSQVTVLQRPGPLQLRETLTRPLEIVGYRFDDVELPAEMVAAVGDEPACLPLLQFVARELWEARDQDRQLLLRSAYESLGGVEGALARHADGVLTGLPAAERRLARELLLRLITPERTRRVTSTHKLLDGLEARASLVLTQLSSSRLVTVSSASAAQPGAASDDEGSYVELAHESLIHSWSRLKGWLDDSRDDRAFLAEVEPAADLWDRRGRPAGGLWHGSQLAEAARALDRCRAELPGTAREFITAGLRRERSRSRRLRVSVGAALTILSVLAVVLIVQNRIAEQARDRADAQRVVAEHRHAESLREGARAAFGRRAMLEARAKLRLALEGADDPAGRALWWQVRRDPLLWKRDVGAGVYDVAVSPDGARVAAACLNGAVYLFDRKTAAARILRGQADQASSVAFSPNGRRLASGHLDGTVAVWDPREARLVRTIAGAAGSAQSVQFHPRGKLLATAGTALRIIDVDAGRTVHDLDLATEIASVRFSPDGSELAATAIEGAIFFVSPTTGKRLRTFDSGFNGLRGASFSPDGRLIAIGSQDHRIGLFRADDGNAIRTLSGHRGQVWNVAFSPDGKLLASAGYDHTVRLWDAETGAERAVLQAHDAEVYAVAFSADGAVLLSSGFDDTVRAWDVESIRPDARSEGHGAAIYRLAFAADGTKLASGGMDSTVRLWDVKSGRQLATLPHPGGVLGVSFSPSGHQLASASASQIHLWDLHTGEPLLQLLRHQGSVWDVSFSPDGQRLVSSSSDGTVRLWNAKTGEHLRVLRGHQAPVYRATFSPDGSRIASASRDATVRIWDAVTGEAQAIIDGQGHRLYGAAFDPSSERVATAGHGATIELHNLVEGSRRTVRRHGVRAYDVDIDEAGSWLGVPLSDRTARLWSLEGDGEIVLQGHRSEVNCLRFAADSSLVATGGDDGTVRTWIVDEQGRPYWRGTALLGSPPRLLSHRGWELLDGAKGAAPTEAPASSAPWRAAMEQRTAFAAAGERWSCLRRYDGRVELWSASEDRYRAITEGRYEEVWVAPFGCVARGTAELVLVTAAGEVPVALDAPPTACSVHEDRALVVAGSALLEIDSTGRALARRNVDAGAVAVSRVGDAVAVGYPEGNVELLPVAGSAQARATALRLERVPSSPPVRILAGPMSTVIVGFANGLIGMWNRTDGKPLMDGRAHGRVVHMTIQGRTLYAATDLGGHEVWDLGVLHVDRCDLLREIWRRIPVVWEAGRAVAREPPSSHVCRK
ncbi:MAG: protein kinase [Deltaproteobacteria bacterium]|jgi:WD40 repeat protein/serine/threonine protein kinase|nr:protein kinase [Deltaproteobacteria bacterium]MBW2530140.1 protein kinase [Deltaproteobacteria bacterium]